MESNESKSKTTIQQFYAGQNVLVTGGTGFLGKVLIEKLLKSCQISSIYVIIRPKKGRNIHDRLEQIFLESMFDRLKIEFPNFRKKIIPIEGDCMLPDFGMSTMDKEVLGKRISIVFHVAATIRFDEKLSNAVATNVRGTKEIIDLCKHMHNLKVLMYVSTLYNNCTREEIDEKFYDPPITGDNILKLAESLDEKDFNDLEIVLKKDFPNTYTYSKAIAEQVIQQYAKELPVGIFRPGIVVSTYQEPISGWIDNYAGPTGAVLASSLGLFRVMNCNASMTAELVPADLTINALIVSAWDVACNKTKESEVFIYNYCSTWKSPITWGNYRNMALKYEIPPINRLWCMCLFLITNYYLYYIVSVFIQTLPAILIDTVLFIAGKNTRAVNASKKMSKYAAHMSYFCLNQWKFNNDRIKSLWQKISLDDQKIFHFSMENFDWEDFVKKYMMGIRVYLLKDPPDTIPAAQKKRTRLLILHNILKYSTIAFGTWTFYKLTTLLFHLYQQNSAYVY